MSYQQNINPGFKITQIEEADLEGSSESDVPAFNPQFSNTAVQFNPVNRAFKEAVQRQQIPQFTPPSSPLLEVKAQQTPAQLLQKNQLDIERQSPSLSPRSESMAFKPESSRMPIVSPPLPPPPIVVEQQYLQKVEQDLPPPPSRGTQLYSQKVEQPLLAPPSRGAQQYSSVVQQSPPSSPGRRLDYSPSRVESSPERQPYSTQQLLISSPDKKTSKPKNSQLSSPTRLNKKIKKGYQMARFDKVLQFKDSQSYRHKNGDGDYDPIDVCGYNQELKQYGLGIFLYFQFIKRLAITLILMSVVIFFPLTTNYAGSGLSQYSSESFTTTLARFTLGNTENGDRRTYLILTISDIVSMLIFFIFWLHWRSYHNSVLEEIEKDHTIVNPVRYVVAVEEFCDATTNTKTLQKELKDYFDAIYKGAFEVEIVYNYQGKFHKFMEYDQLIEEVEKEHQILKQTDKSQDKLNELQKKLDALEDDLKLTSQTFEPMYAYIHFRTLKAKMAFLNHCRRFRLQNSLGQNLLRTLCCTPQPPERYLFLEKFAIFMKNTKIIRPEEINWQNIDMSDLSRGARWICSLFFVILAIAVTSGIIGLLTLYVASLSSCQRYVAPTGITFALQIAQIQSRNDVNQKFCYCSANLASMYSEVLVEAFCSEMSNKVLITNVLQVAASVVSSITNIVLAIIVTVIAKYLLRPASIPKEYVFIFWGVLISSFINTVIIPLLLNANIFGVEFYTYLQFVGFIDSNKLSIFSDFTTDWYALISPYYLTFMIIGCLVSPFISLVVFSFKNCFKLWRLKSACENNDKENPLIQKEANQKVLGLQFQYAVETAYVILLMLIGILYSGLIPLMIPLLAIGMMWIYVCKRAIVVKYSIKIPADETLNESLINFIPFVILAHACFSVWSHTSPGIFSADSPLISLDFTFFKGDIDRIFKDAIILGEAVFMIAVIILQYTLINFGGWLKSCCKDELEVPVEWAAIQNNNFADRIQKTNILGSYKLVNHPIYGHAMKAYNQLRYRSKAMEQTNDGFTPELGLS